MKTIKFIIGIFTLSFFVSCTISGDNFVNKPNDSEIKATGDKGDVTGGPDEESGIVIVKDSITNAVKDTGDKGDITEDPGK